MQFIFTALCSGYFEHQNAINASCLYGVLFNFSFSDLWSPTTKMVKSNFTQYTFKGKIVVAIKLLV